MLKRIIGAVISVFCGICIGHFIKLFVTQGFEVAFIFIGKCVLGIIGIAFLGFIALVIYEIISWIIEGNEELKEKK